MSGFIPNNKPFFLDTFRSLHGLNSNMETDSDNSSTTADYSSTHRDPADDHEKLDLDLFCREDFDFDDLNCSNAFLTNKDLLKLIEKDDVKFVSHLKAHNLSYRSVLPSGEKLVTRLSRTQSFRILNAMSDEGCLDLNYFIGDNPLWFHYLQTRSTHKYSRLTAISKKALQDFHKTVADHLETVESFSRFVGNKFLIPFCFEQNNFCLLSKVILETYPEQKRLTREVITKTLFNALLDKRGEIQGLVTYDVEGSRSDDNTYMLMHALRLTSFDCENDKIVALKSICEELVYSLGFSTSFEQINTAPKRSTIILSALKTFDFSFPLLFDVGSLDHSIPFAISRKNNNQHVTIYNTGEGVDHHPYDVYFREMTFFSIETELTNKKALWTRIFNPPKTVEKVYSNIEALLLKRNDFEPDDSIYYDSLQQRGTCAFQGNMAFIQHYVLENFPGSLEERKGAYKVLKALTHSNLCSYYLANSDPAFRDLFIKKLKIYEAELALFELAASSNCQELFETFFNTEELTAEDDFFRIKERFDLSLANSHFSNFYFLLRITRYIAKTKNETWWQTFSLRINLSTIDNLVNALHTLKHSN